ncbi:MAG: hypothetical protein RLZZ519_2294 [Bacteroidota bacterium]|jgi:hypothetical protein
MKQFIRRFLFTLLPVAVLIVVVNYKGDIANLFAEDFESKIAEELQRGNNVTNVYDFNERRLQQRLIQSSKQCPEVIVLGSSRMMTVNSSDFPGKTFCNHGVSGASMEDLFAFTQFYEEKACIPKRIVIGIDPWTLNANSKQTGWQTLYLPYRRFLHQFEGVPTVKDPSLQEKVIDFYYAHHHYGELFSLSYFKKNFWPSLKEHEQPIPTKSMVNQGSTRLVDGSIYYGVAYRSAPPEEIQNRAANYLLGNVYAIENFDQMDPELQKMLEFLIDHLLEQAIRIDFVLAPYHPKVYAALSPQLKFKAVFESEAYFRDLAKRKGIQIVGAFDPGQGGYVNTDFYDGMHPSLETISKIVSELAD